MNPFQSTNWQGKTPAEIDAEIQRIAGLGLKAAAMHLTRRVKEAISVPAPRRLVKVGPVRYYVATTRATPGAPPRKLSGRLRASVSWEMSNDGKVVRVGTNVVYGRTHEFKTGHQYLQPSLARFENELRVILSDTFSGASVGSG